MKFQNKLFLFLFLIFLVGGVSAQAEAFQFNKAFDLKRACFDRGGFCGAGFECNITLINPDGTLLVDNKVMTDQGAYRNITIDAASNNQLGVIEGIESCTNTTDAGAETFQIQITADGLPEKTFPIQIFIVVLSLIMIGVGHVKDSLRLFQTAGSILLMIVGVLTFYPGYSFINYTTLLGKTLGTIFVSMGFYFMIEYNFSRDKQKDSVDQRPSEAFE